MAARTFAASALTFFLPALVAHAGFGDSRAIDEWQRSRLFRPPPQVAQDEGERQVFIYEGMLESDIDKAMDAQFDRIDTMMFIRTIHTDKSGDPVRNSETGEVVVQDDGC
jgi:hypothetical protein